MPHFARRCLFVLMSLMSCAAWSADGVADTPKKDVIGFHLFSQHIPSNNYNNVNPGIYYRLAEGPIAGIYRNSLRRTSVYAGYMLEYGRFGVTGGVVTGYTSGAQPLLVPSMALFTYRGVTTRLVFIPRVEKRIDSHVLHFVAEI